ncbi:LOW QUALITY PROTEIN: techylectin-5A-like [Uloborus diversus]|uniref:LOW QUALITY PROTEIN: techylectin-5A-like n=1 Tax=Uloborus diversus TaxID=327109 RepID=UPI00240A55F4|nr:LOW QUALITY PROTEIN: techylectin-5A-like [Uloborus diversus]
MTQRSQLKKRLSFQNEMWLFSLVVTLMLLFVTGSEAINDSDQGTTPQTHVYTENPISCKKEKEDSKQKIKLKLPTCPNNPSSGFALDCADVFRAGHANSGVAKVWPKSRAIQDAPFNVYCDMETDGGGWTVIQRRGNFSRFSKDYFYKNWTNYKMGFGNIEKDFWLGNDNIFALTHQKLYSVRFDFKSVDGEERYALYDTFWIEDADHQYKLHIKDYSGDAGDSMTKEHDGQKFSTKDRNNDNQKGKEICAQKYKGAWWYNTCHSANLNGLYLYGAHDTYADGVVWKTWKGFRESLAETEIKIRPKDFVKAPIVNAKRL